MSPGNTFIYQQFGAAIEMLENVLTVCPDELWERDEIFSKIAGHTSFFLHYYLSDATPENAASTSPPPLSDPDPADVSAELRPGKEQLLEHLLQGRQKLRDQLSKHTPDQLLTKRFISQFKDLSLFELLLYNMRHVQHHTAQLNMLLRQNGIVPPKWVSKTNV